MSVNKQIYGPLQAKTLENNLILYLIENYGYMSKPKIAEAMIGDILSICGSFKKDSSSLGTGQMLWPAVLIKEKHGNGKTLARTRTKNVVLSVVADQDIKDYSKGIRPREILAKRIARIASEAYSQGALLAQADIALIFNITQSRVSKLVIEYQNQTEKMLPLRGVVQDIGRSITHKVKIIKMHVSNYSTKDIARSTSHAPSSVDRYIRDFQRIKMLYVKGMALAEIAYITSLSESLVSEYIKIVKEQMLKK